MNWAVWSVWIWPVIGSQAAYKKCERRAGGSEKLGLVSSDDSVVSSGDSVESGGAVFGGSGDVSGVGFVERMFARIWSRWPLIIGIECG